MLFYILISLGKWKLNVKIWIFRLGLQCHNYLLTANNVCDLYNNMHIYPPVGKYFMNISTQLTTYLHTYAYLNAVEQC